MPIAVNYALVLMGFTSLITQVLFIREFMAGFLGNELIIGIILGCWIIFEAYASRIFAKKASNAKSPQNIYAICQLLIACLLPLAIFTLRAIKPILGIMPQETAGILALFTGIMLTLFPLSFLDGIQFPFSCRLYANLYPDNANSNSRAYILEACGFIIAAPLAYLAFIHLNSFQTVFILSFLNCLSGISILSKDKDGRLSKILLFLLIVTGTFSLTAQFGLEKRLQKISVAAQWKKNNVILYQNSLYSNLTVTKSGEQFTVYVNSNPISSWPIPDLITAEEMAHIPLLSHIFPKDVLVIGGAGTGILNEILKYPVNKVSYLELDPALTKILKGLIDKRIEIINIDATSFLKQQKNKFDVIIMQMPFPTSIQINRFYTKEFFKNIKQSLVPSGIFAFNITGSSSYLTVPLKKLNVSINHALIEAFPKPSSTITLLGEQFIYLAGRLPKNLGAQMLFERLKDQNITTSFLGKRELEQRWNPERLEWLNNELSEYSFIRANSTSYSQGMFYGLQYWCQKFSPQWNKIFKAFEMIKFSCLFGMIIIFGLIGIIIVRRNNFKNFPLLNCILTTGFTGMSLQLVFTYAYQAISGYIFSRMIFLSASFMAGLAIGSWLISKKVIEEKNLINELIKREIGLIALCIITMLSLNITGLLFFIFSFYAG